MIHNSRKSAFYHKSVLVQEVIELLNPQPGKIYLDVTFGSGGHTRALLMHEPACRVIGIDWDAASLEKYGSELQQEFGARFTPVWGNFAHLYKLLKKIKISQVDGILADFGTSQMHLFDRPGFSFSRETELDMRMAPSHQLVTAATLVNELSETALADIIWEFGDERYARKIARALVEQRKKKPFKTTLDLTMVVEKIIPHHRGMRIHPATKTFQAFRIYVNKELDNIHAFLPTAIAALSPHARLACITFHSLEDRIIKQFFKDQESAGTGQIITKKGIVATQEELKENPSARSAKLRVFEVVAQPNIR